MKAFTRRILTTFCSATALLLTSCIDVKQDIWIHADGGGKLILNMGISKQALEMINNLSQLGGEDAGEDMAAEEGAEAEAEEEEAEGYLCFDTKDYNEGVKAFLNKKPPIFEGK